MMFSLLVLSMFSPSLALDGNLGLDLGTANNNRANVFGLASIRSMPSTMSLLPRYHVAGSAYLYPNLDYGLTAAALDSSSGTVSLGLLYHRESLNQGLDNSILPGWKLPEDELEQISIRDRFGRIFVALAQTNYHQELETYKLDRFVTCA